MAGRSTRVRAVDRNKGLELFWAKFEDEGGFLAGSELAKYHELVSQLEEIDEGQLPRKLPALANVGIPLANHTAIVGVLFLGAALSILTYAAFDGLYIDPFFLMLVLAALPISLGMIGYAIYKGKNSTHLARHGRLAWAVVTEVTEVRTKQHSPRGLYWEKVQYVVSFAYAANERMYFTTVRLEDLEGVDADYELALYDPHNPDNVELADTIHGGCEVNTDGSITFSYGQALFYIAFATLAPVAIAALGWVIYYFKH
ncbi:MAG: hypothetical protein KDB29_08380 [Planctomycetes bacterium]|nr:hypothetical protein [Planctomycetota bacterium]